MILKKNGSELEGKSNLFLIFENRGQILIFFKNAYNQLKDNEKDWRKQWSKILLHAKRNKLYLFDEEASHQKSENGPPPPISANICQNEKKNFIASTIN